MANYQVHGVFTFQDINGERATMRLPLGPHADTSTVANIAAWLVGAGGYADLIGTPGQHLTNAKLVRAAAEVVFIQAHISGGTAPSDAAFPSVQDKVRLGYRSNNGSKTALSIPAPMDAILLQPPSDNIADAANVALAAFNTLATAGGSGLVPLADGGGNAYGFATGGRRLQVTRAARGSEYVTGSGVIGGAA